MELVCRLSMLGSLPVLQLSGELDLATLPKCRDQVLRAVNESTGATLYIDLDGLSALDDAGLGLLLGAAGRARELGGDVVLVCAGERLRQRLALTGLDRAVTVQQQLAG